MMHRRRSVMLHRDRGDAWQRNGHCTTRREVLRRAGTASAMVALFPSVPRAVSAQHTGGDLPRTIEEAGQRLRARSISVTELVKAYLQGAKVLGPQLNPFITLTEEEAF